MHIKTQRILISTNTKQFAHSKCFNLQSKCAELWFIHFKFTNLVYINCMFGTEDLISVFENIFLLLVSLECSDLEQFSKSPGCHRLSFSSRYWSQFVWRSWGSWHWIRDEKACFQQHLSFKKKGRSKHIAEAFRFRLNAPLAIIISSFVPNVVIFWTKHLYTLELDWVHHCIHSSNTYTINLHYQILSENAPPVK